MYNPHVYQYSPSAQPFPRVCQCSPAVLTLASLSPARSASKPASLNRDRLDEQLREHRQLHADIMSHQVSVDACPSVRDPPYQTLSVTCITCYLLPVLVVASYCLSLPIGFQVFVFSGHCFGVSSSKPFRIPVPSRPC